MTTFDLDLTKYQLGWSDEVEYAFAPAKGINAGVVEQISWWKGEPRWMANMRLRALQLFERKPMAPWFAVNMPDIDFQDIYYYLKPSGDQVDEWDDLPEQMKATYEKLGIPEAERQYLAGVTAQYECLRGDTEVWTTAACAASRSSPPATRSSRSTCASRQIVVAASSAAGLGRQGDLRDPGRRADHRRRQPPSYVLRDRAEVSQRAGTSRAGSPSTTSRRRSGGRRHGPA